MALIKLTRDGYSNSDCSEQYRLNAHGKWADRSHILSGTRLERYTGEENLKDGGLGIRTNEVREKKGVVKLNSSLCHLNITCCQFLLKFELHMIIIEHYAVGSFLLSNIIIRYFIPTLLVQY